MRTRFVPIILAGLALLPAWQADAQPAKSTSELDMSAVPSLSTDGIRALQGKLQERSIAPGPIDGIYGPRTTGAVRLFQERYGIKPSGEISNQLLFALGIPELAANPDR